MMHGLQNRMVPSSALTDREPVVDATPLSPSRLASFWGVHVNTIYRDIKKGALRYYRTPSGRIRIRRDDAERYGRPNE